MQCLKRTLFLINVMIGWSDMLLELEIFEHEVTEQKANEQVDFTWKWHFPLEVQPKFYWHYLAICPYSFSTHLLSICCLSEIIRVCSFENVMCSIWRKFLQNYGKNIDGRKLEQSQCYHWNMVACESRSQDTNSLFFLETGKVGSI